MRAPLTPSVRSANANANANANTTTRTPSKHHRHPNAQQEVDPTPDSADLEQMEWAQDGFFQDLATSIPGIDEAMSFAEVMKQVQSMDYSAIVFDTAPTGHTLRLLNFPTLLEKGLNKLVGLKAGLGGMVGQVSRMMGVPGGEELPDLLLGKVEGLLDVVRKVNAQFQDPALTTFVCVCIPEFLSLYETEDFDGALDQLRQEVALAAVTRSEKGSVVIAGAERFDVAAVPTKVVDTTGAGDAYAAGFLAGMAHGKALPECGRWGSVAAAEAISHFGARPQADLKALVAQG